MHPLMKFKATRRWTWAQVAALCHENGWLVSENSLIQIGMGYTRPSFGRCEFIAEKILDNKSRAAELYRFPYQRSATKKTA